MHKLRHIHGSVGINHNLLGQVVFLLSAVQLYAVYFQVEYDYIVFRAFLCYHDAKYSVAENQVKFFTKFLSVCI